MEPIKLTARQIKYFDEIAFDKRAAKETLTLALNFHSNQTNELNKREKELWDELIELHGLDSSKVYKTDVIDGCMVITLVQQN